MPDLKFEVVDNKGVEETWMRDDMVEWDWRGWDAVEKEDEQANAVKSDEKVIVKPEPLIEKPGQTTCCL